MGRLGVPGDITRDTRHWMGVPKEENSGMDPGLDPRIVAAASQPSFAHHSANWKKINGVVGANKHHHGGLIPAAWLGTLPLSPKITQAWPKGSWGVIKGRSKKPMQAIFKGNSDFVGWGWRLQNMSACILARIYCHNIYHNIPNPTPLGGYHRVTTAAKHAVITKMAENCIHCFSAHPTLPHQSTSCQDSRTLQPSNGPWSPRERVRGFKNTPFCIPQQVHCPTTSIQPQVRAQIETGLHAIKSASNFGPLYMCVYPPIYTPLHTTAEFSLSRLVKHCLQACLLACLRQFMGRRVW
jgi:hypothetical protein